MLDRSTGSIVPLPTGKNSQINKLRTKLRELENKVKELEGKCEKEKAEKLSKLKECSTERVGWRREKTILLEAN